MCSYHWQRRLIITTIGRYRRCLQRRNERDRFGRGCCVLRASCAARMNGKGELRPSAILGIRGNAHGPRAVNANKALPPKLGL
jgi:hypothetical protein